MSTNHQCPRPGCSEQVSYSRLACPSDWFALPANLRIDINAAWRERNAGHANSHEHGIAVRAHTDACATAMQWFRANPKATP